MIEYNNITILNGRYVKIIEVGVEIPLNDIFSDECIKFRTSNKELIHLAIEKDGIKHLMDFGEWEKTIFELFLMEPSISIKFKDEWFKWDMNRIEFSLSNSKYTNCTKKEISIFQHARSDQRYEILNHQYGRVLLERYKAAKKFSQLQAMHQHNKNFVHHASLEKKSPNGKN